MMRLTYIAAVLGAMFLSAVPARAQVPPLDHVVVVVMENHGYDQVRFKPYTASLISQSAACTQSYAIMHPSFPNYLALWAASNLGITGDDCPPAGAPFSAENLGHACEAAGKTWRSYCEDLPAVGSTACTSAGYVRRHAPWVSFGNLNHNHEHPLTDLAPDLLAGKLADLTFVVPNLCHSTHDCSVDIGDVWLAATLPILLQAVGTRGVLILTWDEDDGYHNNRILTVFAGRAVKAHFAHDGTVNHYTVVRTICDALGLAPMANAATVSPIDDIWAPTVPVRQITLGRVKALFGQ